MRLIAIHDAKGRISALITSPPNAPMAGVEVEADQHKTEVEAPEMKFDHGDPKLQDYLAEVIENYIVESKPGKARLIRKATPKS